MESQTTEYKEQWHDKYLAYISGFANAQGGTLYVGLNDSGEVVGINNAKYLLENLPNVCKAFTQANLAAPTFENFWNGTLVQMPRSFNKQAIDQVNDQVNDQIESLQLTDNEKKVYYLIKEFDQVNNQNDQVNDQVTTGYIAQHMGLSYSTIKRILRVLKQHNVIQRVGSDKTGYWQPKKP